MASSSTSTGGHALDDSSRKKGLILLGAAVFALNVGIHVHMTANVNYLHELLSASTWQQGYLEAIRETPGILCFFLMAIFLGRSEPKMASVMLLLTGAGLAAYYFAGSIPQIVIFSLIWSFGLHLWMPLTNSMQLGLARPGREGRTLGALRGVGHGAVFIALGSVFLLRRYAGVGLREFFLAAGAIAAIGAIPCFFVPDVRLGKIERMPFRRALSPRYRIYCAIELLDGMRKQLFLLFAILVLVKEHKADVSTIALLMLISQGICLVAAPAAGYLVDRLGERVVLTAYFAALTALFMCYAGATEAGSLYVIYVIDHSMLALRVAVPTYANRIAAPGERTQLLAMGVTMNHVGAVTLPIVGGALYAASDSHALPFFCGAGVALVSVVLAQFIRPRSSHAPGASAAPTDREAK